MSTSPIIYKNPYLCKQVWKEYRLTKIGNDVWIGAGAIIKSGVAISDGAIVATGSVVVTDVAPYEIVGGVPSKTIRKRFDDNLIRICKETEWWHLGNEELHDFIKKFNVYKGNCDENYTYS